MIYTPQTNLLPMRTILFKLGLSVLILSPSFAYAEMSELAIGTTSASVITSSSSEIVKEEMPSIKSFTECSQEAIEQRDTNIAASRSAYNVTMTNALNERKNREKAAIALKDEKERKEAIKASVDTYKNQTKTAQNTLTQARKVLWQTFENDIKQCRETAEQLTEDTAFSSSTTTEEKPTRMMKIGEDSDTKTSDTKTIKETIKNQIETFFSLFNN